MTLTKLMVTTAFAVSMLTINPSAFAATAHNLETGAHTSNSADTAGSANMKHMKHMKRMKKAPKSM